MGENGTNMQTAVISSKTCKPQLSIVLTKAGLHVSLESSAGLIISKVYLLKL